MHEQNYLSFTYFFDGWLTLAVSIPSVFNGVWPV